MEIKGINSPLDEYSLFIHSDGETLFFSSNGRPGAGGFDLYSCKIKIRTDTCTAENIRAVQGLNTLRNELFPLVTDSGGDLSFFEFMKGDRARVLSFGALTSKPKSVIFFDAYVFSGKTRLPVKGAEVELLKVGKREKRGSMLKISDARGFIGTTIVEKDRYLISINAPRYMYKKEYIEISGKQYARKNFYLKPGIVKAGYTFVAENIYFDYNSAKLKRESYAELQNILKFLSKNRHVKIQIAGFTDSIGSYKFNLDLSRKRSRSISDYLVYRGVKRRRLIVKGFSFTKSIASNETEEGRQKNRRVEIKVIN